MVWVLESGDILGHYRVLSPLGSGGVGQVYLAEDVRLGRRLALKVLSPRARRDEELMARFEREARTISALNHPNILTIYDIGHVGETQFLATEYIDGNTLRSLLEQGRLEVRRALDIALQVAKALAAAHDAGVIHRDLKPENVMIRSDGFVKVLDFGLAKLTEQASFDVGGDTPTRLVDTRDGVVLGTFKYMAPEQARGGELDARADLFALGVLIYEMLAGEPPFTGATAADVIGAILLREPQPLARAAGVPEDLHRLVATALRKDRNDRYHSCAALIADLRVVVRELDAGPDIDLPMPGPAAEGGSTLGRLPASGAGSNSTPGHLERTPRRRRSRRAIVSLAVLPLVNRSQDEELDYLSDGLTESLINSLSQLPRLRVMARSTVFRYKGQSADPRVVGRDLDVQAVLTGHVVHRGDVLTVSAELVDVDDGAQLWGVSLNRRTSDVFVLQAEIAQELTTALRLQLTGDERRRLAKRYTTSAEAYQLYLRGRYFLNQRTGETLGSARVLFERAVAADPGYALAYAGLADCCSLIAVSLRTSLVSQLVAQARAAAVRSLELDERLADGHASLAFIKFRFDWDWQGAEAEFAIALDLNPGHAPSRQWYAMYLASRARFDTALAEMRRALEFDPLSLVIQAGIGRILHFAGRFDEAADQLGHVIATNPAFAPARIDLALTRMAQEDLAAAREELDRAEQLLGPTSTILLLRGCCAVREGHMGEGREAFTVMRERYEQGTAGADDLALMAAVLGDRPSAMAWLTEACAQRSPFLGYVDVEPAMRALLRDPACSALLRIHGFSAAVAPC